VRNRWSVRELESRARAAAAPSARRRRARSTPSLHPDQAAAIELIADTLGAALGREVDVTPAKGAGYRVQIGFESLDEALDVARRLRVRAVS
jgi:ParB family chromosome partitioning protein